MAELPAGSVDLVFADPPFNIGYEYDAYDDRREADEYQAWSREWIRGVIRVLKPTGTFWLAIGDEFAAELKLLCTRELGLHCRSWVVWFYTFGVHCQQKFTRSHAHLFYFVKDVRKFTFNSGSIRVPSARQLVYADKRAAPDGRMPDDTWMAPALLPPGTPMWDGFVLRPQDIPERFPPHSDTWYFSRVAGTFAERRGWHGCQMPEQLLGRIVRACSNEGDLVLDPFGGSGTTLAVAKKLRRRFVGFELSSTYAKRIDERLGSIQPGDPLVGPENPHSSAPRTTVKTTDAARSRARSDRVSTSAIVARANATLGQVAVANGEYATAIAEAFIATHEGYSADRVVADPELDTRFIDACGRLAIPGTPTDWNRRLLNLRKRGALNMIPTVRKLRIPLAQMDSYQYASEIAWRIIQDIDGSTLDDILCDPASGAAFESIAKRIAPGRSAFEYRWAALAVRKLAAKGSELIESIHVRLGPGVRLGVASRLPLTPAHYCVSIGDTRLFVGFSASLRNCAFFEPARVESAAGALDMRGFSMRDVCISYQRFDPQHHEPVRFNAARRARLLARYQPKGNVLPRGDAA